ncbi:MAG: UDP-N-acetyl-D-glucosamine dehydrogenase, partial [Actinobacteria bacterium]
MSLMERITGGSAVFGVVGLGYVGLPLAVEMAKAGHKVVGLDVSEGKTAEVNAGRSYIPDVPGDEFALLVTGGLIEATTDFSRANDCDCIAICVPTPLDKMKEPDTSYMEAAARAIAPHLHDGVLVTLESTTYPGTTEEIVQPILEEGSGLRVG